LRIPQRLQASCDKHPERAAWLNRLAGTVADLERRWSIGVGNPFDSDEMSCAWVAPARRADGSSAILKLGMPHVEGEHEIQGLRFWDGNPTVRLLEADDRLNAMLLERCLPGNHLRALPEPQQDLVIAGLLRRLWRMPSAPHPFRPLSAMLHCWSAGTVAAAGRWPDAGLVREGLRLFAELARTAPVETLLATDMHAGNVLSSEREPWLVIDPKPFVGDPAYDVTQHLFNCSRLRSDPEGIIARMADLLGLDRERVRRWTFARAAAEPRVDWNDSLMTVAKRMGP
jgi:streptomycin 6-kinase